jgi:hypothetical protein
MKHDIQTFRKKNDIQTTIACYCYATDLMNLVAAFIQTADFSFWGARLFIETLQAYK